jgi:hypothetical protein
MSLNCRQRHQLYRIESRLLRSDPELAAMLAVFARLSAGHGMPAWERLATRPDRVRQRAAQIAKAIAVVAATVGLLVSAVLALCTAIFIGSRTRPPQPERQQTGPGTES